MMTKILQIHQKHAEFGCLSRLFALDWDHAGLVEHLEGLLNLYECEHISGMHSETGSRVDHLSYTFHALSMRSPQSHQTTNTH